MTVLMNLLESSIIYSLDCDALIYQSELKFSRNKIKVSRSL